MGKHPAVSGFLEVATLRNVLLILLLGLLCSPNAYSTVITGSAAGELYPRRTSLLNDYLDRTFEAVAQRDAGGSGQIFIAPHTGYVHIGKALAKLYASAPQHATRIIILGSTETGHAPRGLLLPTESQFSTPLGAIDLETGPIENLLASPLASPLGNASAALTSIELQLPFLQYALGSDWRLIPIIVGDLAADEARRAAELLRPLLTPDTILVTVTNFTNYGYRNGYTPFPVTSAMPNPIREHDGQILALAQQGRTEELADFIASDTPAISNPGGLLILSALTAQNTQWTKSTHIVSGELDGDYSDSTSYLAAFGAPAHALNQATPSHIPLASHPAAAKPAPPQRQSIEIPPTEAKTANREAPLAQGQPASRADNDSEMQSDANAAKDDASQPPLPPAVVAETTASSAEPDPSQESIATESTEPSDTIQETRETLTETTEAFEEPPPATAPTLNIAPLAYPEHQLHLLHRLAAIGVDSIVTDGKVNMLKLNQALADLPNELKTNGAAFVTLRKGDKLRGSVGFIKARFPLFKAVTENAINAALRDTRFEPVAREELDQLEMEVSVISPLTRIDDPDAIELGTHGLVLEAKGKSAAFLPSIPIKYNWSKDATMAQLSKQIGLAEGAWMADDATIYAFTTQNYNAPLLFHLKN